MAAISRRVFLSRSSAAVAASVTAVHVSVPQSARAAADYFYYDERFPQAEQLARRLATFPEPIAVRADITPIWNAALQRASLALPLTIRGVTLESFRFCLKMMLEECAYVESQVDRLSHDLYLWSIVTIASNYKRTSYG